MTDVNTKFNKPGIIILGKEQNLIIIEIVTAFLRNPRLLEFKRLEKTIIGKRTRIIL
jgi:hypothetical protein